VVEGGGIEFEADDHKLGYLIKYKGYLEIGPIKFYQDFEEGLKSYFQDIEGKYREEFLSTFTKNYPSQK
jgi:hypothetical protein